MEHCQGFMTRPGIETVDLRHALGDGGLQAGAITGTNATGPKIIESVGHSEDVSVT
jgi:hypothetical protein